MSFVANRLDGERADVARKQAYTREDLLRVRDGFILLCKGSLTQSQVGVIFRLYPDWVGEIQRTTDPEFAEKVLGILQEGLGSSRPHP
jgi:hypothetical protein